MKIKFLKKISVTILASMLLTALSAGAEFDYSDEDVSADNIKEILLYTVQGDDLELSCDVLEERLMLSSETLRGLTFTDIPENVNVILGENKVKEFQKLSRSEVDNLKIYVNDGAERITLGFIADTEKALRANATVSVLSNYNNPPMAENSEYKTFENVSFKGTVNFFDSDGDNVRVIVSDKAKKGTVCFDGNQFSYTPYPQKTGKDSFKFFCEDEYGNRSAECSVKIGIEKSEGFDYADMNGNPSYYAAICLYKEEIMCGEKIGKAFFFKPENQMTRGDFIIALISGAGIEKEICVNTGLKNDSEIPNYLKPYIKAAIDKNIINEDSFSFNEIPTREEAVVMTRRAADLVSVRRNDFYVSDANEISDWALDSYMTLDAYKMLDLHYGNATPKGALTREYCADLLWQLYKYKSNQ